MADMLAAGAAMVANQISEHASQTVTYHCSGGPTITGVKAARGQPTRLQDTQFGVLYIVSLRWEIKVELLVSSAVLQTPQKGDVIEEADGQKWQICPTFTENGFVLGSFGKLWRLETKRIDAG